jgi:hypothetical protein
MGDNVKIAAAQTLTEKQLKVAQDLRRVTGEYTRKSVATYAFEGTFHPQSHGYVEWNARVFKDGELKGTPGGKILAPGLGHIELKAIVRKAIEGAIENLEGVES